MLEEFNNIKKDIQDYLQVRLDLIKLNTAENVSRILSSAASIAIIGFLLFCVFFFLSFAGGYYLSVRMNSNVLGFLSIAGLYFLVLIIFIILRKKIVERPIIKAIVNLFFQNYSSDEK